MRSLQASTKLALCASRRYCVPSYPCLEQQLEFLRESGPASHLRFLDLRKPQSSNMIYKALSLRRRTSSSDTQQLILPSSNLQSSSQRRLFLTFDYNTATITKPFKVW